MKLTVLFALVCITTAYDFPENHPAGKPAMQMPAPRATAEPAAPAPASNDDSSSSRHPVSGDDDESGPPPAPANLDFGIFGQNSAFTKKGQKMSGEMNEAIKGVNSAAGVEVFKPLEDQEGPMRLFYTATPSVTPSPSVSPTPSNSATPSVTPSVSPTASSSSSMTPAPTPVVTPSKSPSPTPFSDGYPPFTVRVGPIKIGNTQGDVVSFTVMTDSAGRVARVGDYLTCDVFVISGGFDPTAFGNVARFTKQLPSSSRYLLPGSVRTNEPDEDDEQCGCKLTNVADNSFTWLIPEDTQGECTEQRIPIDPITVPVTDQNGVIGCHFRAEAFCFTDDCDDPELEMLCSFAGRGSDETPGPLPSNN